MDEPRFELQGEGGLRVMSPQGTPLHSSKHGTWTVIHDKFIHFRIDPDDGKKMVYPAYSTYRLEGSDMLVAVVRPQIFVVSAILRSTPPPLYRYHSSVKDEDKPGDIPLERRVYDRDHPFARDLEAAVRSLILKDPSVPRALDQEGETLVGRYVNTILSIMDVFKDHPLPPPGQDASIQAWHSHHNKGARVRTLLSEALDLLDSIMEFHLRWLQLESYDCLLSLKQYLPSHVKRFREIANEESDRESIPAVEANNQRSTVRATPSVTPAQARQAARYKKKRKAKRQELLRLGKEAKKTQGKTNNPTIVKKEPVPPGGG